MTKTHDKLASRLAIILTKLNQGERFSLDDLVQEFGVSKRTIQRDMKDRLLYLPIEQENGLFFLQEQHLGKLNFEDIRNFATLSGIKDLYPNLDNQFLASLLSDRFNDIFLIKGTKYEDISKATNEFSKLENAIKNRYKIELLYNQKQRELNPYRLVNTNGIWYLLADENNKLKTFTLSKISNLKITNTIFIHNEEMIEILNQNKDRWFSQESIEVTLQIDIKISEYFLRRELLPYQKILEQTQDHIIIYTKVSYEEEILTIVKSWIPYIKILKPSKLQANLNKILKQYIN